MLEKFCGNFSERLRSLAEPVKDRLEKSPFKTLEQVSHCQGYLKGLSDAEHSIKAVYEALIDMRQLREHNRAYDDEQD